MKYIILAIVIFGSSCSTLIVDKALDDRYNNELSIVALDEVGIRIDLLESTDSNSLSFLLPGTINGRYFYRLILRNEEIGLSLPIFAEYDHGYLRGHFFIPGDIAQKSKLIFQYHNRNHLTKPHHEYVFSLSKLVRRP